MYKRCTVVFNLDNPLHQELYDWCTSQSTNFSDFTRTILHLYKQSKEHGATMQMYPHSGGIPREREGLNQAFSVSSKPIRLSNFHQPSRLSDTASGDLSGKEAVLDKQAMSDFL